MVTAKPGKGDSLGMWLHCLVYTSFLVLLLSPAVTGVKAGVVRGRGGKGGTPAHSSAQGGKVKGLHRRDDETSLV